VEHKQQIFEIIATSQTDILTPQRKGADDFAVSAESVPTPYENKVRTSVANPTWESDVCW
jgi:hypothetical protein